MKVLAVTRIFPNAREPLSAPFNRQQFAALNRLCDVEVLATLPWFPGARFAARWSAAAGVVDVPGREEIDGLSVLHPRTLYIPRIGHALAPSLYAASVLPFVWQRRNVDVLLGAWAFPDGVATIGLGRVIGRPVVIKVHGSDINVIGQLPGPQAQLRRALPHADRVVAVSRALADAVAALGVAKERIVVVRNGVDETLFSPRDRSAAAHTLGLPPASAETRTIVYVGRLQREKGLFDLIDAFKLLTVRQPSWRLYLVGSDGGVERELKARAAALGERVRFVGARPIAEVPLWIAAGDLLTLPSWNEGTPNVVLEALACGRPVVATRVGGIPDVVRSELLGELVAPRAPHELCAALERVGQRAHDPRAIAHAGQVGGWLKSASELHTVLEDAKRAHARGRG